MNGASWACGCGPSVRLGPTTLIVRGRTVADYALFEAEILNQRGNVFDLVRRTARGFDDAPERQREVVGFLLDTMGRRWSKVTPWELFEWLNTWRGRTFALWLAVRDNDPPVFTFEYVTKQSSRSDWTELIAAMDQASANDERCAAAWQGLGGEWDGQALFWPAVFRRLAEPPFHLHAADVGRLTLQQLRFLLWEASHLNEHFKFESLAAFHDWRTHRDAARNRAVDNVIRGRRWNAAQAGA